MSTLPHDHREPDDAPLPLLSLVAAIVAISVAGMGFGHSLPLYSYVLKSYEASDFVIGSSAAFGAIASLLGAPFYPRAISLVGLKPFLFACLAMMVVPYLLVYVAGDRIVWWYPLRFVFSLGGAGLFAASEIWINAIAPDRVRGKVIGLYATCLSLGFASGPLMLRLTGYEGFLPFAAGAVVFALAALPLAFVRSPRFVGDENAGGIFRPIVRFPVVFGASAMFAGVESAMLIFLPILALELGHGVGIGALSLTIYGMGLVVAQLPVGQLTDMFPARRVMAACAALGGVLALMIPLVQNQLGALYVVLFVWGGAVGGIYTAGLVIIGHRFKGAALAPANSAFVFTYAAGAVIGPFSAGVARTSFGPDGLVMLLVLALLAYAWAAWRPEAGAR